MKHAPARIAVAVVAIAASLMLIPSSASAGQLIEPEEKIVYRCSPGPGFDICIMNENGTGYEALTNDSTGDAFPRISPDGERIAWTRDTIEIWTMDIDGSNQQDLIPDEVGAFLAPTWSPDGSKIAFSCNEPGNFTQDGLCMINSDGTGFDFFYELDEPAGYVEWSPEGGRLLLEIETESVNDDLFVLDLDTLEITNVTNTPDEWEHGTWSPDGTHIAFVGTPLPAQQETQAGLYMINPDGSGRQHLYTSAQGATATQPTWSPNGEQIAYVCNFDEICIASAGGGLDDTLTEDFADKFALANAPDWAAVDGIRHGDTNCNGEIQANDGVNVLADVAGIAGSKTAPCPDVGEDVASLWGDLNCNEVIDPEDALLIFLFVAGHARAVEGGCGKIGAFAYPAAN